MTTYDVNITRHNEFWLIDVPATEGMTQARFPAEIFWMARDYIAIELDIDHESFEIVAHFDHQSLYDLARGSDMEQAVIDSETARGIELESELDQIARVLGHEDAGDSDSLVIEIADRLDVDPSTGKALTEADHAAMRSYAEEAANMTEEEKAEHRAIARRRPSWADDE